jgi:hypothetical protein
LNRLAVLARRYKDREVKRLTSTAHARRLVSLGSSGFATLASRSLRSTTLPSPANPRESLTRARFIGSGNVVGRRPLGASFVDLFTQTAIVAV